MIEQCKKYLVEVEIHTTKLNSLVKEAREAVLAYERAKAMELPQNKLFALRDAMKEATEAVDTAHIYAPGFDLF